MTTSQPARPDARIQSCRDLIVWQRAMQLAADTYALARLLPPDERFGLQSQLRRAAVSVAANIAEGHGRLGTGDYTRHLSIARGSLMELGCLLELGANVGYFDNSAISPPLSKLEEVGRMLWVLIRKLGSRQIRNRSPVP